MNGGYKMNQEDRNQNTGRQDEDYKSSYSYDNSYYDYSAENHTPKPTNGLAVAALVVGILSILTCCCGIGGIVFGCTGIFLAVMSKERSPMQTNAKVGLILSIIGVILGFLVIIGAFLFVRNTDEEYRIRIYDYLENYPYEDYYDDYYEDYHPPYEDTLDDFLPNYRDTHI